MWNFNFRVLGVNGFFEVGIMRKCEFIITKCFRVEENRVSVFLFFKR